jgi:hypothetical protein
METGQNLEDHLDMPAYAYQLSRQLPIPVPEQALLMAFL